MRAVTAMSSNVVAKAATIGPAAGDNSADVKRMTRDAPLWKHIATEDAQAREARHHLGFVGWGEPLPARRAPVRREIHLDHVGYVDSRDIDAIRLNPVRIRAEGQAEQILLIRNASSGLSAYLLNNLRIVARAGAAIEVLVHDSDEAFVKERVALTSDLHPRIGTIVFSVCRPRHRLARR